MLMMLQKLVKDFAGMGFKPEVKDLKFFQDDYGLEAGDRDDTSSGDESAEGGTTDDEGPEDGSTP